MSTAAHIARAMHTVIEPINSITYFSPQLATAWRELGLEPLTQGYFGGRAAPLGPVSAPVVTATFFNFSPAMVGFGIPSTWEVATPAQVLAARARGMQATFEELQVPTDDVSEATDLARRAMDGVSVAGRPLAAGNTTVGSSGAPLADLWQALTTLREHRGDGHVALLVAEGLTAVQALVLYAQWEQRISRRFLQGTRGWDDDAWQQAIDRLAERGLVDPDGMLTEDGHAYRQGLEDRTDQLAAAPWENLGASDSRRLHDLLLPIASGAAAAYPRPFEVSSAFPDTA